MSEQIIGFADNSYSLLKKWLEKHENSSVMLVCGSSFDKLGISKMLKKYAAETNVRIIRFSDFSPNPDYSSVVKGTVVYNENKCTAIIAVGGGSAMDVAKCIKLFYSMDTSRCFLEQNIEPNSTELFAVPTTAGTGSEATRYAVIYYNGVKQSVTHNSCIPQTVLFDPTVLTSLNDYHRKASMLDALCHSLESFWSVNSNAQSIKYSTEAIKMILHNADAYLTNDPEGNKNMMYAAYLAGKAINITQTTAGHALCYKLTGLYGIAHGFAAAICTEQLWFYMLENCDKCSDVRGEGYLRKIFREIAETFGCNSPYEAACKFSAFVGRLFTNAVICEEDVDELVYSVNLVRLKNNPVTLDKGAIRSIYTKLLK